MAKKSNRVFTECEKCGTSVYIMTKEITGKDIEVNAQMITLKRALELYGNKVYYLVDENGRTFIDYERRGFLPHKYTCKGSE